MGGESKQDLRVMEEINQERIGSGGGGRLEGGTRHSPNTTKSPGPRAVGNAAAWLVLLILLPIGLSRWESGGSVQKTDSRCTVASSGAVSNKACRSLSWKELVTTGNAAFVLRLNFCRASFIGCTAKSFFAVRHTIRTVTNLCRASYFKAHGKESLPCVLNTDARQIIFFFLHSLKQTAVSLCRAFRSGARQRALFAVRFATTHGKDFLKILIFVLLFISPL
jgi:hypothetical protein